jgi:hypothetical protein
MGYVTALQGVIHLSPNAFRIFCSIDGLNWSFDVQTLSDYLRGGLAYDETNQSLRFAAQRKMYHHRAFFNILAFLKDVDGTDEVEQIGETYDAWFEDGRFFVERGRWAYCGSGPMLNRPEIVGPVVPTLANVQHWQQAIPLARRITIHNEVWLEVELWSGEKVRAGIWNFEGLGKLSAEELAHYKLHNGGAVVYWGDEIRVSMDELLRFRED